VRNQRRALSLIFILFFSQRKYNIKVTLGCLMIKLKLFSLCARVWLCVFAIVLLPRPMRPPGAGFFSFIFARSAQKVPKTTAKGKRINYAFQHHKKRRRRKHKTIKKNEITAAIDCRDHNWILINRVSLGSGPLFRSSAICAGLPVDYAHFVVGLFFWYFSIEASVDLVQWLVPNTYNRPAGTLHWLTRKKTGSK